MPTWRSLHKNPNGIWASKLVNTSIYGKGNPPKLHRDRSSLGTFPYALLHLAVYLYHILKLLNVSVSLVLWPVVSNNQMEVGGKSWKPPTCRQLRQKWVTWRPTIWIWSRGKSIGTEPWTCGINFQVDSVRIELNCRTPRLCCRII